MNLSKPTKSMVAPKAPPISDATRFGLYIVVGFFCVLFLWSVLFPIESAAVAPGKVTVNSNRKTVQHLEGGIIHTLRVTEGKLVKQGELLIQLDDTQAKASLELLQGQVTELMAAEARLKAERDKLESFEFPLDLQQRKSDPKVERILSSQQQIFITNKKTMVGQIDILNQRITQLHKEIESLQAQVDSETKQLKLVEEEITAVKYLEEKKLIEKPRLLALQREAARILGDRGEHLGLIARAQQRIGETQTQILTMQDNTHRDILNELRETQQRLAEISEKEKAAQDILNRTAIIAPQDGKVVGLSKHTIGGVINPGEEVLHIIPTHDELVIEAQIKPLDIDVVHEGLMANVQFTAFKQRQTPTLSGKVTYISADIFEDPNTKEAYYRARVSITKDELKRLGELKLYQGMPAQVMIVVARRTPFNYFISPITESFNRAFRED